MCLFVDIEARAWDRDRKVPRKRRFVCDVKISDLGGCSYSLEGGGSQKSWCGRAFRTVLSADEGLVRQEWSKIYEDIYGDDALEQDLLDEEAQHYAQQTQQTVNVVDLEPHNERSVSFGAAVVLEVESFKSAMVRLRGKWGTYRGVDCDVCGTRLPRKQHQRLATTSSVDTADDAPAKRWIRRVDKMMWICNTCEVPPRPQAAGQAGKASVAEGSTEAVVPWQGGRAAAPRSHELATAKGLNADLDFLWYWALSLPSVKPLRQLRSFMALGTRLANLDDDLDAEEFCWDLVREFRARALDSGGPPSTSIIAHILRRRGTWCQPLLQAIACEHMEQHETPRYTFLRSALKCPSRGRRTSGGQCVSHFPLSACGRQSGNNIIENRTSSRAANRGEVRMDICPATAPSCTGGSHTTAFLTATPDSWEDLVE